MAHCMTKVQLSFSVRIWTKAAQRFTEANLIYYMQNINTTHGTQQITEYRSCLE